MSTKNDATLWPKAFPPLVCHARFKCYPEDFEVHETLSFTTSGAGEHLFLQVEKRGLETRKVAEQLARVYGVAPQEVGYAGMKDKRAVARQWFSVPTRLGADVARGTGWAVRDHSRHVRKLRRGQLAANRFVVRLRSVTGTGWEERLGLISRVGTPNYFGPQRFGGDNLPKARAWLPQRQRRSLSRFRHGLYLSVLRSYLFNELLARRVREDCWRDPVAGDVLVLDGAGNASPTGPLWGRGRSPAASVAADLEMAALAPFPDIRDGLEHAGLAQQRRSLVLRARNLTWSNDGADVVLAFELPPGEYATSLLREAFELAGPEPCGERS